MKTKKPLTQERLKELLEYFPDTGNFVWKVSKGDREPGDIAGCVTFYGYIQIGIDGTKYFAHRLAWLYMTGAFPKQDTDHINRCKADNRWSNLRDVSRTVNNYNKDAGYRKHSQCDKYEAYIHKDGKKVYLGLFNTEKEAKDVAARTRRAYSEESCR